MNNSGDAAEQIVRMSLEGVEVAAKITGTAAKEIATFLVAALKNNNSKLKLKGKARMASMLKSGKVLEIFSVKERDLKKFAQGAKQYGIVYCVLRNRKNSPDGLCDIMVKADDAPKISRIVERFQFGMVDRAKIESEIIRDKAEKSRGGQAKGGTVPPASGKKDADKLLDELLGADEGKAAPEKPTQAENPMRPAVPDTAKPTPAKEPPANPTRAKTAKPHPSAPTSESRSNSAGGTSSKKPSVKEELRQITAALKKKEADTPKRGEKTAPDKPRANSSATHKQPQAGGKSKSKKTKGR